MSELMYNPRFKLAAAATAFLGSIGLVMGARMIENRSETQSTITSQQGNYQSLLQKVDDQVNSSASIVSKLDVVTKAACSIGHDTSDSTDVSESARAAYNKLARTYSGIVKTEVQSDSIQGTASVDTSLKDAQKRACPTDVDVRVSEHSESSTGSNGSEAHNESNTDISVDSSVTNN